MPNLHGPASGGLAVLCRQPRRIQEVPHAGIHADRWIHAAVELSSGRALHVISLYGYDSGQPSAARRNAELFREVLEVAVGLGQVYWIVGGDWNVTLDEVWEVVADEGRSLLVPRSPEDHAGTCRPAERRIDYFVASACLAGSITAEEVMMQCEPL